MHEGNPASFRDYVSRVAPGALPTPVPGEGAVHGTTIVTAAFDGGVLMAGDRRATLGSTIAMRDIEKVFGADRHSVIGIAGVAGLAVDLVRLFQVELEHYEKVEFAELSLDGKANRLGTLLRANLPQAMQGLGVLPLFVGWDPQAGRGRMFSYDATGGRYEEQSFAAVGSGAVFARGALKKLHDPRAGEREAALALLQSLYDAADDDSATSGLDLTRGILPLVMSVTAHGVRRFDIEELRPLAEEILAARAYRPDGPRAGAL
ncbi:proteasome subunit beta [Tessaracoccus rhinocerotis]|uniref:Proteasome subunit beta n=1 Tax=Tessaracoccus rhinocerotis TaxID=1689449 RepID=A0A553JY04_9ACTN|nr:proteasome subunit beta [Tessaracoccus rhinocerotis]TRY17334.1 proteasome subunit beta [Tessaracoccus rhinocerotis]